MAEEKVEYYELIGSCYDKNEMKEVNMMVHDGTIDIESFLKHVVNGINKISTQGKRLLGFVSEVDADYLVFEPSKKKFIYEFEIDKLKSKDDYHCTLRFNNINPVVNVYAIGYQIGQKHVEYYDEIGRVPMFEGKELQEYLVWVENQKKKTSK